MSNLVIVVLTGRRRCGSAVLLGNDGKTLVPPLRVLATASEAAAVRFGNPHRDWNGRVMSEEGQPSKSAAFVVPRGGTELTCPSS
jgi:hypothetical protein